jgi:ABC-type nitrate/sulfonate/bicarbonate transport system substrate-binding protein
MMKKSAFSILAMVMFMVLVTGCSQNNQTVTKGSGDLPIIRYANLKVYDPVYIGIEKGFFKNHGVEVKIVGDNLGGPTAIQAVSGGSADAGLASIPAIINSVAAGLPILGVTDIQSAVGKQALETYFVRADSKITSIKDLKGKKVAVNLWNSSFHYTVLMALEKAGISEKDVQFVLLPFDQQAVALEKGEVDVIGLMEPYVSQVQVTFKDRFKVLFNALDVFGEKQFTLHFINKVWAKYNPDSASAFVAGIVDSVNWIKDNDQEAKQIVAKYTGVDAKYVPTYTFQNNARVVPEDVKFWIDYMVKRGDVKVGWLKPEDIGTNQYNYKEKK